MAYYSHSQVNTFTTCQLKYRFQKVDRIKPGKPDESLNLLLGSVVHEILERLYQEVRNKALPTKENMLEEYEILRNKKLSLWEQIQHEVFLAEAQGYFRRGEEGLVWYYETYAPFDQSIVMAMEENIQISFSDEINFRGVIDRFDIDNRTAIIVDYKTSKRLSPDKKDKIFDQLTLYGIGVLQAYPRKFDKVVAKVIYLDLKREDSREVTDEVAQSVKEKYVEAAHQIAQKVKLYEGGQKDAFEAQRGNHCDFCDYKPICPLRSHFFMDEEASIDDISNRTLKFMIDDLFVQNEKLKNLEKEVKSSKQVIVEYAKKMGVSTIFGNDAKVSLVTKTTYRQNDKDGLLSKLEELGLFDNLKSVDSAELAKKLKDKELDFDEYKDYLQKNVTTYISRISEIKKNEEE